MATVSPFLLAVVILIIFLAIVLIIIVIVNMRSSKVVASSTPAAANCTAAPAEPVNVVVTNPQGDILTVSWSPLAFATSYTVYVGTTSGFPTSSAVVTRTVTTSSTSFGNLSVGVQYYIKLIASNNCGTSPLSNEVSHTIPYNYPGVFTINSAVNSLLEVCYDDSGFTTSFQESARRFCNIQPSRVRYNSADQTIRLNSVSNLCLTRTGGEIFMNQCVSLLQPPGDPVSAGQDWGYFSATSRLCSPTNPTTQCLLSSQPMNMTDSTVLTYGPPSTPNFTQWNLVAV